MDTRSRLALAGSLCLLPVAPLGARLAQLQVMQHDSLDSRAEGALKRTAQEAAPRADILDRNGNVLAQSIPTWACFVDLAMVKDKEALSRDLARVLGVPGSEMKLKARGRFAWAATGLDFDRRQAVSQAKLAGVGLVSTQERFYPNGELARGVLGMVGAERSGLAGIELAFDGRLRGAAGKVEYLRDGAGRSIYQSGGSRQAAEPLRLTLDRNIQYYAEEILKEAAAAHSIRSGLVAVQNPGTGELLAMAAYPQDPLKNAFVQDTYEPGSTFKVVTIAAALEDNVVSLTEKIFCENGKYALAPGVMISDHEPKGSLDMREILQYSSNIGSAKVAERVGALRFYRMSRAFGFASRTGITLPGETAGELKPLSDLTKVALAASSYGYSVSASALQVISAYSAIANGGTLYEPQIVSDGRKPARVRRVASARAVSALQEMLENVVSSGTGMTARIAGYRVAGKTGTSRKMEGRTGKYSQSKYMASFVGYLPAGKPRWTILVVIDEPKGAYFGSQVAAPVFAKLGLRLLTLQGVPPDEPLALKAAAGLPP